MNQSRALCMNQFKNIVLLRRVGSGLFILIGTQTNINKQNDEICFCFFIFFSSSYKMNDFTLFQRKKHWSKLSHDKEQCPLHLAPASLCDQVHTVGLCFGTNEPTTNDVNNDKHDQQGKLLGGSQLYGLDRTYLGCSFKQLFLQTGLFYPLCNVTKQTM